MISMERLKEIVEHAVQGCTIKNIVLYENKYIIFAPTTDPFEGNMDPFYVIDAQSGILKDYPIMDATNKRVYNLLMEVEHD